MSALRQEDLAQGLKDLDLDNDNAPLQRSLGLYWDLPTDSFTFRIADEDKPFTRRGLLSTLNSIFDPLGFIAPVIIHGKLILRKLMSNSIDWDEPLPDDSRIGWETWKNSLTSLQNLTIPRMYVPISLSTKPKIELHVFADASEKAISAVSYLRTIQEDGTSRLGFAFEKPKLRHSMVIPYLDWNYVRPS